MSMMLTREQSEAFNRDMLNLSRASDVSPKHRAVYGLIHMMTSTLLGHDRAAVITGDALYMVLDKVDAIAGSSEEFKPLRQLLIGKYNMHFEENEMRR